MALTTHHPAHVRNIVATGAEWYIRDQSLHSNDFNRQCQANQLIEFKQDTVDISVAVLVSAGCSHIAVVEADASKRKIKVTVYSLNNEVVEQWSTDYQAPQSEFRSEASFSLYETAIHGGVTEDGQNVLLVYRPKAVATRAYLVNARGFTWRKPPSDNDRSYSSCIGMVSEDSEYLFYVRSAARFGRGGEAKAVEAYSIRHLACARAETFGFGDGRKLRNVRLLRQIDLRAPIYMAIDTSNFTDDDTSRHSPPLIVSSDGSLHWNFSGIDKITHTGGQNCFISPDNVHLFYVEPDTAMLHHWDLKKLSLKSLGSVRLPGVEYAQHRTWLIRGQETRMKDSIAEQSHQIRYSPKCKTITVVTVNDSSIVVNVLSTYNLQLIYHETIKDNQWPLYVPVGIGFNDTTGLNIFAMFPAETASTPEGHLRLFGIKAILISLPEVFKKVKAIEQYFDHVGERILALPEQVACRRAAPICTFAWKPGVMDRNDEFAIPLVHGEAVITNAEDARRQNDIYTSIYAHPSSSWRYQDSTALRRFFVPHLFSFTYLWAPHQRVSIFGVIMENEYHIISVGPPASTLDPGADVVIRVLYASDIKISKDETEYIEVFRTDCHHVIRIYNKSNGNSSYSGAPMPIPRWTAMTPHFLEEDAWFDTFIIHRGAHVTMPNGWTTRPNIAITSSTSFYAYLRPRTFIAQDEVNYGLRTRSAYVMPKHILWKQYGLRGLRVDNQNEIFFGGGQYADFLGSYFSCIYEDKSYDDSSPLFPSTFAMACNENYRSQKTTHVDAFFRRLRKDKGRLLENSVAITCALPLACKARPGATLSFMRYIALYPWLVNDIGAVQVKRGATGPRIPAWDDTQYKWLYQAQNIWLNVKALFSATTQAVESEPNKTLVTLPLAGFCSFGNKLYKPPPVRHRDSSDRDGCFWEFILATTPYEPDPSGFLRHETWLASSVARSGRGPASPFTRLVEGILDMKHRDLQLSYLRVVWLEKLLVWKMHTFGRRVYLTRMALPMLVLLVIHLIVGILLTNCNESADSNINWSVFLIASIEGILSCFILSVSLRQAYRIPRVFLRSIFHFVNFTALSLGLATFLQIVTKHPPSRAFLAYSTLVIWIAAILILRIYKRVGILLLLVTEAIQEVFSFLVLVFFIILGI